MLTEWDRLEEWMKLKGFYILDELLMNETWWGYGDNGVNFTMKSRSAIENISKEELRILIETYIVKLALIKKIEIDQIRRLVFNN